MKCRVETALLACVCLGGVGAHFGEPSVTTDGDVQPDLTNSVLFWDFSAVVRQYESWFYSIIGTIFIGLCGIFPLLVIPIESGPSLKHGGSAQKLRLLLSFAVGSLLGDVFLHLLPEAWEHLQRDPSAGGNSGHLFIGIWILVGIFTFVVLEKLFAVEEDDVSKSKKFDTQISMGENNIHVQHVKSQTLNGDIIQNGNHHPVPAVRNKVKISQKFIEVERRNGYINGICNNNNLKVSTPAENQTQNKHIAGYLNLLANCIDNFAHGLAVAGSFLVSKKVGILTTFAILIHEIPHEIGDFAILLNSGFSRFEAGKAQVLTATGGLLGAITALSVESTQALGDITLWILPFTAGGFLNIALVNVLPDLIKERDTKESVKQVLCMLAGVAIMACVTVMCE